MRALLSAALNHQPVSLAAPLLRQRARLIEHASPAVVHREACSRLGQRGRVFGYNNIPIEDPTRTGKYRRPAVSGVKLEINPEQAAVVNRNFSMSAAGIGQGGIAIRLNAEGIPGPNGRWSRYTIHEMLRNERYRGICNWGRTKKCRNPETGRKVSRATPQSQWRRVEVPELRIVAEELWLAAETQRKDATKAYHRLGGMARTDRARNYLFSGSLICGECGGSMVICAGGGKRGYVKYGCHTHKQRGTCANKRMIRQDRLEEQMLAAIQRRVLEPALLGYDRGAMHRRVQSKGCGDAARGRGCYSADRKRRQAKLIEAIETTGDIASLTERLRTLERDIESITQALKNHHPLASDRSAADMRSHVTKALLGLKDSRWRRTAAVIWRARRRRSRITSGSWSLRLPFARARVQGDRTANGQCGFGELSKEGWWPGTGSNRRHTDFQSVALPAELPGREI